MEPFFPFQVGAASFFRRSKGAEMDCLAVNTDRSPIVLAVGLPGYSRGQIAVSDAPSVLGVGLARDDPKVIPPVVCSHAVDVVDFAWRFLAVYQQPDYSMFEEFAGVDTEVSVGVAATFSYAGDSAGALACISTVPGFAVAFRSPKKVLERSFLPGQLTGLRVVVKTFAQICEGWHDFFGHVGLHLGSLVRAITTLQASLWPAVYALEIVEMQA